MFHPGCPSPAFTSHFPFLFSSFASTSYSSLPSLISSHFPFYFSTCFSTFPFCISFLHFFPRPLFPSFAQCYSLYFLIILYFIMILFMIFPLYSISLLLPKRHPRPHPFSTHSLPPCFQGFSFLLISPILPQFSGYIRLYYAFSPLLLQDISI